MDPLNPLVYNSDFLFAFFSTCPLRAFDRVLFPHIETPAPPQTLNEAAAGTFAKLRSLALAQSQAADARPVARVRACPLADGKVQVNADALGLFLFSFVDTNQTGEHQVTDKHVPDRVPGIRDIADMRRI